MLARLFQEIEGGHDEENASYADSHAFSSRTARLEILYHGTSCNEFTRSQLGRGGGLPVQLQFRQVKMIKTGRAATKRADVGNFSTASQFWELPLKVSKCDSQGLGRVSLSQRCKINAKALQKSIIYCMHSTTARTRPCSWVARP